MTFEELHEHASELYKSQGRFVYGFAKGKIGSDPVFRRVLREIPSSADLYDLGCGEGYLLALLAVSNHRGFLRGIDHDAKRVEIGKTALLERASFDVQDLREIQLQGCDIVTCFDVLHYQKPTDQDAILHNIKKALRAKGVLYLRDGRSDQGMKSLLTKFGEQFLVALGRHKGDGVYFRPQGELEKTLENMGFSVSSEPCSEDTPFANHLITAVKR